MTKPSDAIRDLITTKLADLRTMRDEIKLKAHLAGMDAKQSWSELEPRLEALEREAATFTEATATATVEATKEVVHNLVGAFEELRAKLDRSAKSEN